MFHEAWHVTIESSVLAKLLQAFEESADWVLLIGVERGKGPWPPPKFLAYLVILCFERLCIKPSTVPRLKSKYLAPPKMLIWLRHWLCFFTLQWLKCACTCIRVTSLRNSDTSESICNFFYKKSISCKCNTTHSLISPENSKQCLQVKYWKAETRAENANKSKNKIKINKSKYKLQPLQHWKIRRSWIIAFTETESLSEVTHRAMQQNHIDCISPLWLKTERW